MYYPIGWHKVLNLDLQSEQGESNILLVQANHERELFFILTTKSIHIWYPKPLVEIVCHRRSTESIKSLGYNRTAVWKTDSSVIVVATDRDQLLFYQIRRRVSSSTAFLLSSASESGDGIYKLRHDANGLTNIISRESKKEFMNISTNAEVPALTIFSFGKLDLSSIGVSCLMSAEEELIVGARNGDIYGVYWSGNIDNKFPWSLSKSVEKGSDYIIDLKFSSVLSGFSLVFCTGKVGFMPLKTGVENQENGSTDKTSRDSKLHYLPNVDNAICTEINHRYRLVAIGLKNSKIVICNIDDMNASFIVNHELQLQSSKFPHDTSRLASVNCMRYSPDSSVLVTSWEGGDFAIWSVFGSLLFCTQQWQSGSPCSTPIKPVKISSISWGREGYNLWLSTVLDEESSEAETEKSQKLNGQASSDECRTEASITSRESAQLEEVSILSFARTNLSSSPHSTCSSDSVILVSEDRLYVGPSIPHKEKFDHWFVIDIPQHYLEFNYPIKYITVDRNCKDIAIAGIKGFALYSITNAKWKFFDKKSHEESFSVCGDLIWWNDQVIISCFNYVDESFEIRAYSTSESLNNAHMVMQSTPMEIMKMSIFENRILVLYSDGTLGMFMLNIRKRPKFNKKAKAKLHTNHNSISTNNSANSIEEKKSTRTNRSESIISLDLSPKRDLSTQEVFIQISPIENLVISNLQANSYCISSIALTRLHFKNNRLDDSILLNACGKLFLLERDAQPNLPTPSPTSDLSSADFNELSLDSRRSSELEIKVISAKRLSNSIHFTSASLKNNAIEPSALSNVTFKAVSVIATNVEQFWISPEISHASDMSYFKKSLWLYCGGQNNYLQVWLPLLNDKNDPPTDLYVPDRIMLPIKCDIYPLAIRASAPDVVEPDDAIVLGAESDILYKDTSLFTYFPFSTVKRQCRVYLHRILRELLLAQHLGYYARKIAERCQSLPYFAHCFELLLHEVLEEEATSPVPLPDPMLPQIVRFIKEFPVYLETVVHCARKSELSMWSHLFDERAVGNPRRLFQECLEKHKLDTAASCLIILQSLDRNIVSQRMVKELIKAAKDDSKYNYLIEDLESFLTRAELDYTSLSGSGSPS